MAISAVTIADNETVGSTEAQWIIADPSTADRPNHQVHYLSVSVKDPSAVLLVTVGRTESTANESGDYNFRRFRGNIAVRQEPVLISPTGATFHHVHGRYFVSGGQPFQLKFDEPLEGLRDAESSTDKAVMVTVKRVDTSTAVGYTLTIWCEEY